MVLSKVRLFLVFSVAMVLVVFSSCKQNRPPSVPAVPAGPEYCYKDMTYTFKTTAVDPDGDSVEVRFDWGDSTVSLWEGWFASGETMGLTHSWSDTGTFEVRASAQDLLQHTSGLSGGHAVRVGLRWPPNAPAEPSGRDVGGKDSSFTFTTAATHPGSLTVAVRFAWGDGDTSAWSSFVASGESVAMSHSWSMPDTYVVTAQAKDTGNALSLWSVPHSIVVRPPNTLLKWRVRLATGASLELKSSPAIAPDGTIYVGSTDSSLYAIKPDGTLKWRYKTGGSVLSSPSIAADGTVYVGSNDNQLYAINPDSTLKWSYGTAGDISTSPAIAADGTVYVTSWIDLRALSPDGTRKWEYYVNNITRSSPTIAADGTVYIAERTGDLLALYPDAVCKWSDVMMMGVNPADPAIAGDGTFLCGSEDFVTNDFVAWAPDGHWKWSYAAGLTVRATPAVAADGTVYFGSTDKGLYAVDSNGNLKWRYQTGGEVDAGPALAADGTVYVGSNDSSLYALNAEGTLKWRYETGGHVEAAPTIGTDGTVYFISDEGYLYALKGTSPLANSPWPKAHHDLQNTGRAAGDGHWSRLDMVGNPAVAPDSSGFLIRVANHGNSEDTISSLIFSGGYDAYMRDFLVDSMHGYGFPIPDMQPAPGPGDTLLFAPVTVAPNGSQQVELQFLNFHGDSLGFTNHINVVGKEFGFRFADGWEIVVRP